MSDRVGGTMVSDRDIAEALHSLLRQPTTPPITFSSLNDVVRHLESKLGFDLTHKVDFIRHQIHLLFRSQPPPQPPQPPPPPQQPPSSASHLAVQQHGGEIGSGTKQLPPHQDGASSATASSPAAEDPKESSQTGKRKRGGTGGLNKLCGVSPELQAIVGQPKLPRTEIVKQLWAYIRKHNLQDPDNKRRIICNDELRLVFETDCTDMFKMNKLLSKHIITLEPSKPARQHSKKEKAEAEPVKESTEESGLVVIISEALGKFFGSGEREMPQPEVLRRVWEYIKANQLEDPMNSVVIRCDEKLQDLFGCSSISVMGIPEMLARRHLFKRS